MADEDYNKHTISLGFDAIGAEVINNRVYKFDSLKWLYGAQVTGWKHNTMSTNRCESCYTTEKPAVSRKKRMVCDDCFECFVCQKKLSSERVCILLDRFYCLDCRGYYQHHRHLIASLGSGPVCRKFLD
ncbi:unnamed protein product [Bursaphelenchus okinawaensis]|uniref:LIM zinc-binding domain-containing protein n=1 Tax=Bursaphelenchus okinawaensis TaxID=465554 RepID=A0A811LCE1_9BILA|nr:unnamed protein product [Bursaphelenchus okinawaensis]CAG9120528.1 unnamed protein product [Bursaphelenchus okinawaensis]